MSKHTPGPWVVRVDPISFRPSIETENKSYFIAHVDECMAKEANARLIAAAPELQDQLIETHAALCFSPEYLGSERYKRNAAIIAKATGEQP